MGDPSLKIYGINMNNGEIGEYAPAISDIQIEEEYILPTVFSNNISLAENNINISFIKIFDIAGRYIGVFNKLSHINILSNIPNGVYFLEVTYSNYTKRTIKILINY